MQTRRYPYAAICLGLILAGCSSIPKKEIQEAASKDLKCLSVRIGVEKIGKNKYLAEGCGNSAKYKVKGCKEESKPCSIKKI